MRQHPEGSQGRISIHPPRVGRDRRIGGLPKSGRNFNPPSPCGEGQPNGSDFCGYISNFNPPSPCGEGRGSGIATSRYFTFQSTLPVWGGTEDLACIQAVKVFQSTLPVWGGTHRGRSRLVPHRISIHPPRVGRDSPLSPLAPSVTRFQSTLPVWGGTVIWQKMGAGPRISIHPPRVGRDLASPAIKLIGVISIHPPRVGRDNELVFLLFFLDNFNPPSPCGEGRFASSPATAEPIFQSTLPVWGGTAKVHKNSFLFHALLTNSLAFFVTTSCFLGENQKTGDEFVKISVRRSQGNPGRFPLAPV